MSNTNSDTLVESDETNMYSSILISTAESCTKQSSKNLTPTDNRIDFIKQSLEGMKIQPMIDFDLCDTETATGRVKKKLLNIKDVFLQMGLKLSYVKSGTTGHTFKAVDENKKILFALKVCAYPKDEYGAITNSARPENAELRILKLLSYFVVKKSTPHFVLPVSTFNTNITHFTRIGRDIIDLDNGKNEMYKKFITKYKQGEFENFVSVLISEWCNGGDLLDYIRKNYEKMNERMWKVIFFQILYTLALVQLKYPNFRHNDLKANNILVQLTESQKNPSIQHYRYNLCDKQFIIPNIDIQIKIWDFDFACVDGLIENNKVNSDWTKKINVSKKKNRYYDVHYFFNTLISKRFFPQFEEGGAPQNIVEFVHRIIPIEVRNGGTHVNKKGRILVNNEITTPFDIIMSDPLFEKYRF